MKFCPNCGMFVNQKLTCPKCHYTEEQKPPSQKNMTKSDIKEIIAKAKAPKKRGKRYNKLSSPSTTVAVPINAFVYSGTNAGKYIEEPFFNAKKSAHVCSPWIYHEYTARMKQMADKGVDVKIITSDEKWNEDTVNLLKTYDIHSNFNRRIYQKGATGLIHTKLYIIDGQYAVSGSCNFTTTGLWGNNHELITICNSSDDTKIIEGFFSKLWNLLSKSKNN